MTTTETEQIVIHAADTINARLPQGAETPRGFSVSDHLNDRTKAQLLELAKSCV